MAIYQPHEEGKQLIADLRAQLAAVCKAALDYDAAIQRHAAKGKNWTQGDDLDDLYADWINLSRYAIARLEDASGGKDR